LSWTNGDAPRSFEHGSNEGFNEGKHLLGVWKGKDRLASETPQNVAWDHVATEAPAHSMNEPTRQSAASGSTEPYTLIVETRALSGLLAHQRPAPEESDIKPGEHDEDATVEVRMAIIWHMEWITNQTRRTRIIAKARGLVANFIESHGEYKETPAKARNDMVVATAIEMAKAYVKRCAAKETHPPSMLESSMPKVMTGVPPATKGVKGTISPQTPLSACATRSAPTFREAHGAPTTLTFKLLITGLVVVSASDHNAVTGAIAAQKYQELSLRLQKEYDQSPPKLLVNFPPLL